MFQRLTDRLQAIFKRLRGHGKLTEDEINTALREIRLALLEADVHYGVAKDFLNRVRERAIGRGALQALTPGRGGAAPSLWPVTGCPLKCIGARAQLHGLQPPRAEGMASRILGMGDVLSLV